MALEEVLVDRHVLDGGQPAARFECDNGIDETVGKPVQDAIEHGSDVDRSLWQGGRHAERLVVKKASGPAHTEPDAVSGKRGRATS